MVILVKICIIMLKHSFYFQYIYDTTLKKYDSYWQRKLVHLAKDQKVRITISQKVFVDFIFYLSFEWNSIRLGGPAHGIVTKTVHKILPGGGGGQGGRR